MKLADLGVSYIQKTSKDENLQGIWSSFVGQLKPGTLAADSYDHAVVPIEEWISDPYYVGDWAESWEKGGLYPKLRESIIDAWKPGVQEVILAGAAGSGKCLAGDTLVPDPDTGRLVPIRDCAALPRVASMLTDGGKVGTAAVTEFVPSGVKPVVRLETTSGREVVTTPHHQYFTDKGWKPVYDLAPGDLVAVPRRIPIEGKRSTPPRLMELLGMLVADGGLTNGSPKWTCADPVVVTEFSQRMKEFFPAVGENMHLIPGTDIDYALVCVRGGNNDGQPNPLKEWLKDVGIWGKHSPNRFVPTAVFESDNSAVRGFLRGLYSGDGYVERASRSVGLTSASKSLVEGVRHLLLRLGINGRVRARTVKYKDTRKNAWVLSITGKTPVSEFKKLVGFVGKRATELDDVCAAADNVDENTNVDVLPSSFWRILEEERAARGVSWIALAESCGWACRARLGRAASKQAPFIFRDRGKTRSLSRALGQRIADALESEKLREIAYSDIFWDRVGAITPCGETDVYDLSVPGPANFVAADIICHNTNRACLLLLRLLYELLCYKEPAKALGLSSSSTLAIAFVSVSKQKSREVGFDRFASMVKGSPWFMEHYPPNRKYTGKLLFESKKIVAKPVISGERGVLSEDLIGLLVDEAAFMDVTEKSKKARGEETTYDAAAQLYHQAKARMETRFHQFGKHMPGKIIIASSAQFPDDFVSRRRVEVIQKNEQDKVYVSDLAVWEAKPEGFYSRHTFRVEVGDEMRFSRILKDDEDPRQGSRIINVPVDLKDRFEGDIDRAIRDLAGVPLLTLSPLITDREKVRRCFRTVEDGFKEYQTIHPYDAEVTTLQDGLDLIRDALCFKDKDGHWYPRVDPRAPRFIHFDPSFVDDATGVAMAHPVGKRMAVEVDIKTGQKREVEKTATYVDFMLRVVRPDEPGREISWVELEHLVEKLTECGFDIALITVDSPAGRSFVQRFRELGYYAETGSVDKTVEQYMTLKKQINEGLVSFYEYEPFTSELFALEWNKRRNKVDHPRRSYGDHKASKDVADAVAMAVFNAATRYEEFDSAGASVSFSSY